MLSRQTPVYPDNLNLLFVIPRYEESQKQMTTRFLVPRNDKNKIAQVPINQCLELLIPTHLSSTPADEAGA